jgi:hypothetical protein
MKPDPATVIRDQLKLARLMAEESYGAAPPPEIVASILNALSAQQIGSHMESMTYDLCRAAAVAAGD